MKRGEFIFSSTALAIMPRIKTLGQIGAEQHHLPSSQLVDSFMENVFGPRISLETIAVQFDFKCGQNFGERRRSVPCP